MYPGELLNLFPPFPRNNIVFVAMSFDPVFTPRWENVIEPAISSTEYNGKKLTGHRIDLTKKSDSIITEIVLNISQCRLVFADISTIGHLDIGSGKKRAIRNGNVLYEVGIAHAARLAEEVILVRSDDDPLDFDVSGVRVHSYDPKNENKAIAIVKELIVEALKSVDSRRSIAVKQAVDTLDLTMYWLLQESITDISHPPSATMRQAVGNAERLGAINRLLRAGMFEVQFKKLTAEVFSGPLEQTVSYRATPFGRAVLAAARERAGFEEAMKEWLKTPDGRKLVNSLHGATKKDKKSTSDA